MGHKIVTLTGAATDVLYALFFNGALQSGDLPSKSGAAELRELGFAETRHTATQFQKENYFTFLTAEGQDFAIRNLVNTRYCEPAGGYIGNSVDALDEIADALDTALARHYEQFGKAEPEKTSVFLLSERWVAIEGSYSPEEMCDAVKYIKRSRLAKEMEKSMKESSPFAVVGGQVFFNDAFINDASKTTINIWPEMEKAISDAVSAQLKKNLQPGGMLWNSLRRGS
ncbi:hypothetical protein [Cronobacter dublinensis]|uniref:hypothetical protein n=1 Tax=Cronobacter dublinensis TaxID=413497 RepID=UPI0024AF124D|nr:hypothetical protein [Cronobacter dublinensis]MDI7502386.1 hypothetical protein [Cronobacter dublinensis]